MSAPGALAGGAMQGLQQVQQNQESQRMAMIQAIQLELQRRGQFFQEDMQTQQLDLQKQAGARAERGVQLEEKASEERFKPFGPRRTRALSKQFHVDEELLKNMPRGIALDILGMVSASRRPSAGGASQSGLAGLINAAQRPDLQRLQKISQAVQAIDKNFADVFNILPVEVLSQISGVPVEELQSAQLGPRSKARLKQALLAEAARLEHRVRQNTQLMLQGGNPQMLGNTPSPGQSSAGPNFDFGAAANAMKEAYKDIATSLREEEGK